MISIAHFCKDFGMCYSVLSAGLLAATVVITTWAV